MATTTVGVRELKARATGLVRRAAGGERVVITRYGRPCAVLGPVSSDSTSGDSSPSRRMQEWLDQRGAFERMHPRLEHRYRGRWVAIHGGRVVGSDSDADALFERVWVRLRGKTFYVGRVGAPPQVVDVPGFEVS